MWKKRRTILFVLQDGDDDGALDHVEFVGPRLAKLGFRVGLLTDRTGSVASGIEIRHVASLASANTRRVLDRIRPDVVYAHRVRDPAILAVLDPAERRHALLWRFDDHGSTCLTGSRTSLADRSPTCLEPLGDECLRRARAGHCHAPDRGRPIDRVTVVEKLRVLDAVRRADAAIVPSEFLRRILVANAPDPESRIHVVADPILAPPLAGRPLDPRRVAFPAAIRYESGLHVLLEGLPRRVAQGAFTLDLTGPRSDPGYCGYCRELVASALEACPGLEVRFVTADESTPAAGIVIVPSVHAEPTGTDVARALASGAAVIASDSGANAEWIRDRVNGLVVPARDPDSIVRALDALLEDPRLRASLGAAGLETIRDRNPDGRHARALAAIVESALAARSCPA